jgi:hypothetical protein
VLILRSKSTRGTTAQSAAAASINTRRPPQPAHTTHLRLAPAPARRAADADSGPFWPLKPVVRHSVTSKLMPIHKGWAS